MKENVLTGLITRHRSLVLAIIIAGVAGLMILLVALPLIGSINKTTKQLRTKTEELEDLAKKVSILAGIDQSVLKERVTVLDAALPPKRDVMLYLTAISGLSQELGVSFGGISLEGGEIKAASTSATTKGKTARTPDLKLDSLDTEIKITGSQESIYAFLRTVETTLPLMQIGDVKVSASEEGEYTLSLGLGMLWAGADSVGVKGQITLFDQKEEEYFTRLSGYRRYVAPELAEIAEEVVGRASLFTPQP